MTAGSTLIKKNNRKEIIVSDWDGVIQDIDFYWMTKLIREYDKYAPYFDFTKIQKDGVWATEKVWDRDTYYMNTWLAKEGVEIPTEIVEDFVKMYIDDDSFYFHCPFMIMAETIRNIVAEPFIEHVYFLSSAPKNYAIDPRKSIMLEKFFGKSKKISLEILHGNTPKSTWINEHVPEYTLFIDDRSDIVRDVIDHTNSDNKQYILPCYRHNTELGNDLAYIKACSDRGIVISTYKSELI